jgi:serine/threonine protein kinase
MLSVSEGEEKFGRHGDIKPENILWFEQVSGSSIQDEGGVLKIADFGLGRFHGRDSRSNVDFRKVTASPTYEPPECKLERPVSRAYDIWSLACLYLEFVTWLLEGTEKIEKFGDARGEIMEPLITIDGKIFTIARSGTISDDNFFTILNGENGKHAIVRKAVVEWVDRLHAHEACSQLIHDLLDLVMADLLKIDSTDRINASQLNNRMAGLAKKAASDKVYLLKAVPRPLPPITTAVHASGRKPSKGKKVRFAETWPMSTV